MVSTARQNLAAAAVNGFVYAVGGNSFSGTLKTLEAYDPTANTWSSKAPMPTARSNMVAAVVDGNVYAAGGYAASGVSAKNEAYTPADTIAPVLALPASITVNATSPAEAS